MPVLYGVFLFMGVSSLTGVQLMQRISIIIMPPKYQPDYIYLRHVPLRRVHLFTAIQVQGLFCFDVSGDGSGRVCEGLKEALLPAGLRAT